jgi:hypothetical protein
VSGALEFLLLFAPLALLAVFVFRADRGSDPGNAFAAEQESESEVELIRRNNGGSGGGYMFVGGENGGGGDGGGGGD